MAKLTQETLDRFLQIEKFDLSKVVEERERLQKEEERLTKERANLQREIVNNSDAGHAVLYKSGAHMLIVEGKQVRIAEVAVVDTAA